MAKTWIYAASAAAIGGALIGGWLLDPAPPEASPQARSTALDAKPFDTTEE
ncbi:hypothetical protein DZ954_018880, partial [Pseudomonas aeruginosa]|nr:hypothetical protein [Pseudomonas aeruginosa]